MATTRTAQENRSALDLQRLQTALNRLDDFERNEIAESALSTDSEKYFSLLKFALTKQYFALLKGTNLNIRPDENHDGSKNPTHDDGNVFFSVVQYVYHKSKSKRLKPLANQLLDILREQEEQDLQTEKRITIAAEISSEEDFKRDAADDDQENGEESHKNIEKDLRDKKEKKPECQVVTSPSSIKQPSENEILATKIHLADDFMIQVKKCFEPMEDMPWYASNGTLSEYVYEFLISQLNHESRLFQNTDSATNHYSFDTLRENTYQIVIDSFELYGLLPYSRNNGITRNCLDQFFALMRNVLDKGPYESENFHYEYLSHKIHFTKLPQTHNPDDETPSDLASPFIADENSGDSDSENQSPRRKKQTQKSDGNLLDVESSPTKTPPKTTKLQDDIAHKETLYYAAIANLFRLCDWYEGNDLGERIASECGAINTKKGHLKNLLKLRDAVIKSCLKQGSSSAMIDSNIENLKKYIIITCNNIRLDGGENSRVANALADLVCLLRTETSDRLVANEIPIGVMKIQKIKTDKVILKRNHDIPQDKISLITSLQEDQAYIKLHLVARSRKAVIDYLKEGFSRILKHFNTFKRDAALKINAELFSQQKMAESAIRQPSDENESRQKIDNASSSTSSTSSMSKLKPLTENNVLENIKSINSVMKTHTTDINSKKKTSFFSQGFFAKMTHEVEKVAPDLEEINRNRVFI